MLNQRSHHWVVLLLPLLCTGSVASALKHGWVSKNLEMFLPSLIDCILCSPSLVAHHKITPQKGRGHRAMAHRQDLHTGRDLVISFLCLVPAIPLTIPPFCLQPLRSSYHSLPCSKPTLWKAPPAELFLLLYSAVPLFLPSKHCFHVSTPLMCPLASPTCLAPSCFLFLNPDPLSPSFLFSLCSHFSSFKFTSNFEKLTRLTFS